MEYDEGCREEVTGFGEILNIECPIMNVEVKPYFNI
jgi:hypothetical protein